MTLGLSPARYIISGTEFSLLTVKYAESREIIFRSKFCRYKYNFIMDKGKVRLVSMMEGESSSQNKYRRKKKYKSKRTGVEKIIIEVYLPVETYNKLKEIADRLFPYLQRGKISYTLEQIIDFYYAWHTQNHTKPINPRTSTREAFNKVLLELERRYDIIPKQIPNVVMWDSICLALNIRDPRTVRKWLHRFTIEGLIKPLSYDPVDPLRVKRSWKIVWEIVAIKV